MKISGRGLECELQFSEQMTNGGCELLLESKRRDLKGDFDLLLKRKNGMPLLKLETSIGKDIKVSWGNMAGNINFQFSLHKSGALEGKYKFSPDTFGLGPTFRVSLKQTRHLCKAGFGQRSRCWKLPANNTI